MSRCKSKLNDEDIKYVCEEVKKQIKTESPLTRQERIDIAIKTLQVLAKHLDKCPTVAEFDKVRCGGYVRRDLEKHLGINYSNICRRYIPEYKVNIDLTYDESKIRNELQKAYDTLGRAPMFNELNGLGILHGINLICKYLKVKTYNDAIIKMGWLPSYSTTKQKTKEVMLDEFYKYFIKLGRIPYAHELNENGDTVTHPTYTKHFESIENVCDLLDIKMDKYYVSCNGSRICYDNNGDICRSNKEKEITNFLIHNNIKYEKEVLYSIITKNKDDNRRLDWVIYIDDIPYYVEYFGLYGHELDCIRDKYQESTHKKISDLKKYNCFDNSILIYPKDIRKYKISDVFNNKLNKDYEEYICKSN